jgi:hypothetical protein
MVKYKFICDSNVHEFEKKVQDALTDGWELFGNVSCCATVVPSVQFEGILFTSYCREMVKQEDKHDE